LAPDRDREQDQEEEGGSRRAGPGLQLHHPEWGHHIGGSDASGIVLKVGAGVTKRNPGDEVVIHCNQASYEDVHRP